MNHVNRKLRNSLIAGSLVVALAIAFVSALPQPAEAEEVEKRLISVTGEAKIEVKPDMATMSFGVEVTAADAQTAQRENSAKMTAVIEVLTKNGVQRDDIQTSNFSLSPVYEWLGERGEKQTLVGYRCNNTVTVEVKDLSKIGTLIDAGTAAGANNVYGLTFGLQSPAAHRNALLTSAVNDARAKADILAAAAGYKVSGVQTISDPSTSVSPIRYSMDMVRGMEEAAAVPIEGGMVTLSATIRIDYTF